MLTRLYIDNFRCFVNFECRFGPRQLILGANGSGKSTLFDVLMLLREFCIAGEPPDGRFQDRTRTRWQDVSEQTFELDVEGPDGTYTLRLVLDSWGRPERPRVVREEVTLSGNPLFLFDKSHVHLFNDFGPGARVQYDFDWLRSGDHYRAA